MNSKQIEREYNDGIKMCHFEIYRNIKDVNEPNTHYLYVYINTMEKDILLYNAIARDKYILLLDTRVHCEAVYHFIPFSIKFL